MNQTGNFASIVTRCVQCGCRHSNVTFRPFVKPVRARNIDWTHMAICPIRHEPILARSLGPSVPLIQRIK